MIFKKPLLLFLALLCFFLCDSVYSYEIFIYRPYLEKRPLFKNNKISLHGEFFGQLQYPSTFPSYNDLSGPEDRWTFGFQNLIFLTENTSFLAQLITHDDGHKRTKFDWHFSLRHFIAENFVIIVGHDSNHDSDYQSTLNQESYFLNRNYVGFGLPIQTGDVYVEPFTWFFHHTNQRGHLDLSGKELRQEYGLRVGIWLKQKIGINFQILTQTETIFSLGQTFISDLIIRIRLLEYLEFSLGASLWKDIQKSLLGNQKKYYKLTWGVAIPF